MLMKTTAAHAPASQGTSGIVLDSLRVAYHGNVVLKPLSLTIEPGEVLALIGPSGSGKTTVLRAVAGFVQPAGGRILIGDTDVTHLPPYKRGLAMVVQNYALFPHLKVEDNVAFGLRAQKQPKALINERVTQALKTVGMSDYATRYPHQLSGGQQQRVAIARAIAVRPRVLLLDEPLSALDAQIRHNMVEEIARLHRELPELTILYVTHDQTEALTLADKIGIMKDGSLIAHGETRALYHHPPNRFAAEILRSRQYSLRHRAGDNGGSGAGGRQLRRCGDSRVQPGQPPRLQQTAVHSSSAPQPDAAFGLQQPLQRHTAIGALARRFNPSVV